MPAPADALAAVTQAAAEEEARAQERLAFLLALLWFSYGGVDDVAKAKWVESALPVLAASRAASVSRGWTAVSVAYALAHDRDLEAPNVVLGRLPAMVELERRAVRHVDAPVVRARWELSRTKPGQAVPVGTVGPAVEQAKHQARDHGLFRVPKSAEVTRYEHAMDRGAAVAVKQALGDCDTAYGVGADRAAEGRRVRRWLKVPHGGACDRCVLVSARGYRTAESAKRAGHRACRCGVEAVWAGATGRGERERVRNVDWQRALDDAGYSLMRELVGASPEKRAAILGELFPGVLEPEKVLVRS